MSSSSSERQSIIADSERDTAVAESAGKSAASKVVSVPVNVATGGISGYVQAGGGAAVRAARAEQIGILPAEAEEAAGASHSQSEAAAGAPAGLIGALRSVRNCLLAEAGGEAAAGVIPFAGTVVSALVDDSLRQATATIWALMDNNDRARRAAAILGINEDSSAGKYGSSGKDGGMGGGGGGGAPNG
jgi:hypothetical protein